MTTATAPERIHFSNNVLLKVLLGWYVLFWIAMAISPLDRPFWMLTNVLPIILIGGLIATHRSYPLSDVSYLAIGCFLSLHAIGAHYTYTNVPFGFWMEDLLGFHRNHFDRIVHFSFGFLIVYPFRELLHRSANITGFWAYALPVGTVMAFASIWEVLESWVARIATPELGQAALGSQGDIWDAQRDMASALYGAVLCILFIVAARQLLDDDEDDDDAQEEPDLEAAMGN
jgi:putative membrane protein